MSDILEDARTILGKCDLDGSQSRDQHAETCHYWHPHCLVEKLAAEIERLREYVRTDARCPCCDTTERCESDCTFAGDCPVQWQRMVAAREALGVEVEELEAASGVESVVRDMTEIVRSSNSTDDEKHAAMATLVEDVCPGWVLSQAASGGEPVAISPAERDGLQGVVDGVVRNGNGFVVLPGSDSLRAIKSILDRHSISPPPRGWLTAEERGVLRKLLRRVREDYSLRCGDGVNVAAVLDGLLARDAPPKVRLARNLNLFDRHGDRVDAFDAAEVLSALAAAGVEVSDE